MKLKELIGEIEKFGEFLKENGRLTKYEDFTIYGNVSVGYAGSKLGMFIHAKYGEKLLTWNKKNWGTGFYYNDDFNYYYEWATSQEHREVFEDQEVILKAMQDIRERIEKENEEMGI